MGGDKAPEVPVAGALAALSELPEEIRIALVGEPERIIAVLPPAARPRIEIVAATDSIVVGLQLVRSGMADAFISAGSTGAVMAASVLELGALPGVGRPAVGAMFPTITGPTLVLDVGANVDTKGHHLHQFARLGSVYVRDLRGLERPRVGLLNVGEEAEKGGEAAAEAYSLLDGDPEIQFVGNVEGHRIIEGVCDVLVSDGFAGNVLLKFYESIAGFVVGLLQRPTRRFRRGGRRWRGTTCLPGQSNL